MKFFSEMFGKADKPRYSFELINNSLLREDRNKIAELITRVDAGQSPEEKMGPWTELTNFVSERFADVKVSSDEESIANFIKTFAQLPQKMQYSEVSPEVTPAAQQTEMVDDLTEINPDARVFPTRVVRQDQFDGLEPVASATIITPEIISARQRGMNVDTNPERRQDDGEAAMERLLEEAKNTPPVKAPVGYSSPYAKDEPLHVAKNDSVPGSANTDWILPNHRDTIHPKPPEHLIK